MALSEEEHSKLTEVERELTADRMLTLLFTVAFAPLETSGRGPGHRMMCSRAQRRRR